MLSLTACSHSSLDPQLIGTWKSEPDDRGLQSGFVFSADHTFETGPPGPRGTWQVAGKRLTLHLPATFSDTSDILRTLTVTAITHDEMKLSAKDGAPRLYKRVQ
jgi:hypothetical protein